MPKPKTESLKDYRPQSRNANKHTQRGLSMLEKSIQEGGFIGAMTSAADGEIFDGSARLETVGHALPVDPIVVESDGTRPIIVKRTDIPSADDPKAKRLALMANRTAQVDLEWDAEILKGLEEEIKIDDLFTENEMIDIGIHDVTDPKEDDVPAVPAQAKSVLGDLYELGRHRVLCGDSTNSDDVARLMDGKKAELLFTSPPYSDMRTYEGGKDLSVDALIEFIPTFLPFTNYQVINLGIQRKEHDIGQYWDAYIKKAKDCGYKFLAWNVWDKNGCVSIGQQKAFIPIHHEWIFVFGMQFKDINRTKNNDKELLNNGRKKTTSRRQPDGSTKHSTLGDTMNHKEMSSVSKHTPELGAIRAEHPATFPVALPAEYIYAMTNENDIIAEPFLGSGTTLIAAEQTNRTAYGMELEPKYIDVIVSRYCKFTGNNKVIRNGSEITWEM